MAADLGDGWRWESSNEKGEQHGKREQKQQSTGRRRRDTNQHFALSGRLRAPDRGVRCDTGPSHDMASAQTGDRIPRPHPLRQVFVLSEHRPSRLYNTKSNLKI